MLEFVLSDGRSFGGLQLWRMYSITTIIMIINIFSQEATSPSGGFQAGPE